MAAGGRRQRPWPKALRTSMALSSMALSYLSSCNHSVYDHTDFSSSCISLVPPASCSPALLILSSVLWPHSRWLPSLCSATCRAIGWSLPDFSPLLSRILPLCQHTPFLHVGRQHASTANPGHHQIMPLLCSIPPWPSFRTGTKFKVPMGIIEVHLLPPPSPRPWFCHLTSFPCSFWLTYLWSGKRLSKPHNQGLAHDIMCGWWVLSNVQGTLLCCIQVCWESPSKSLVIQTAHLQTTLYSL